MRTTVLAGTVVAMALAASPAAAQEPTDFRPPSGSARILQPGERLERLWNDGCVLTEGPAAGPDGAIYFTDINDAKECSNPRARNFPRAGLLWRYDLATRRATVFRRPSGQANGLLFDLRDRLVAAEGANFGGRRLSRTDLRTRQRTTLTRRFDGRRYNSPNDLAIDARGRIYFTDPRYNGAEPIEQPLQAVYRLDPSGRVTRVVVDASKPNGVAVSPDGDTLYVAVNDRGVEDGLRLSEAESERVRNVDQSVYAYPLRADGTVGTRRRRLVSYLPETGPDGMDVDARGNLYVAVRDETAPGVYVYSPRGRLLARIPTGDELPTNVAWGRGAQNDILYVTAGYGLYRIDLNTRGFEPRRR
jgi:gluconolactonase